MPRFDTKRLPANPDVAAPDGSQVRILLRLDGEAMPLEAGSERVQIGEAFNRPTAGHEA